MSKVGGLVAMLRRERRDCRIAQEVGWFQLSCMAS